MTRVNLDELPAEHEVLLTTSCADAPDTWIALNEWMGSLDLERVAWDNHYSETDVLERTKYGHTTYCRSVTLRFADAFTALICTMRFPNAKLTNHQDSQT